MKNIVYIFVFSVLFSLTSCSDNRSPNYQFMPNMYESVGYEPYSQGDLFLNGQSARLPAEGSVPRGYVPYEYDNTLEGFNLARAELKNPLPVTQENLDKGRELFGYFCAVCHGGNGDGQGILTQREKFLGIPSYADPGRNITEGSIYHVQMYGINAMGEYVAQTTPDERWQITMHVLNLKAELEGTPKLQPISEEKIQTSEGDETVNDQAARASDQIVNDQTEN